MLQGGREAERRKVLEYVREGSKGTHLGLNIESTHGETISTKVVACFKKDLQHAR